MARPAVTEKHHGDARCDDQHHARDHADHQVSVTPGLADVLDVGGRAGETGSLVGRVAEGRVGGHGGGSRFPGLPEVLFP